ncbi:MAG: bifunctional folylpolyglutamate synthase/dihydrofolate synthase [Magnetococcales bacterium]|nr:bifunctional folylpolyglutamate synthase/dihydrofolate synthase [Magnetococcales bacterium]
MNNPDVTALLDQAHRQSALPIQLGLERVERLLADLDNPHQTLDVVHVAGTNGKGSVLAFLEAILRHAGYRVGLYTSPHLHRVHERIRVDGQPITDAQLGQQLAEVMAVSAGRSVTFFELLTVVALRHFQAQGLGRDADGRRGLVLLETGLGGRLDATNVVLPHLSIVTSIDWDHTDYLGTTLAAIATEKAGIFKRSVPAVAASGHPEVERVLLEQARTMGTPLAILGRDFTLRLPAPPCPTWWLEEEGECEELPLPGLAGRHQLDNAALAVAGIRRLRSAGWPVARDSLVAGLRGARWPGRLERLAWPSAGGLGPTILLDGAHNPAGCTALAHFLDESGRDFQPTFMVFSALQDKEVEEMVHLLAPHVERVWTTHVGGGRGRSAEELAALWRVVGRPAQACATPEEALAAACVACPPVGQVVVCGSLYLVGAVRAALVPCVA